MLRDCLYVFMALGQRNILKTVMNSTKLKKIDTLITWKYKTVH